MKHLKITYGDAVLWDAPVGSLEWHDSENGVKVDGRIAAKPASSPTARGVGIFDMLAKASKAKTSQLAEAKREAYEAGSRLAEAQEEHDEAVGVAECNTPTVEAVDSELDTA